MSLQDFKAKRNILTSLTFICVLAGWGYSPWFNNDVVALAITSVSLAIVVNFLFTYFYKPK